MHFKISIFILAFLVIIIFPYCSENKTEEIQSVSYTTTALKLKGTAKAKLSEYGFFKGALSDQIPADDVTPYTINAPLFSDYAHKARFVKLPEGASFPFHPKEVFDFPLGTTLIKTFYYPFDFRDVSKGKRILETRLLVHEVEGWAAYSYIWNEEQSDAFYEVAGARMDVTWTHTDGSLKKLNYVVPNINQCKGCHTYHGKMMPIGPKARNLNGDLKYPDGTVANQLLHWQKNIGLSNMPELSQIDMAPSADHPTATLAQKARAYLDVNCAHCHREGGPAVTSGLLLEFDENNETKLGIFKGPVAAGRGSGNLKYDIYPGKPDESILVYRMKSTDPGEMMPELGRKMFHQEGVQLIHDWIAALEAP